jgi:hypothetical protein
MTIKQGGTAEEPFVPEARGFLLMLSPSYGSWRRR